MLFPADIVSCNFLPKSVKPGLEQVCHSLLWSRDNHVTLDDPLWKDLDQFEVPKIEVNGEIATGKVGVY